MSHNWIQFSRQIAPKKDNNLTIKWRKINFKGEWLFSLLWILPSAIVTWWERQQKHLVFYLKNWLQTSWWSNYHRKNSEMYFLTCRLFVQLRWRNGRGSWMCHPKVTWLPLLQKVWNCASSLKEVARPDDRGARSRVPSRSVWPVHGWVCLWWSRGY